MAAEIDPGQDATQHQTIVAGAGPAGMAVAACLKRAGVACLILEQTDKVGAAWRRHYDRLHLHTAKAYSALPYFPFPKDTPRYPSRLQVISYLEAYAQQFQLEPRFGQQIVAARHADDHWEVETQDNRYRALNLVIATGCNREPYLPDWPGQAAYRGALRHSSQYRNGEAFAGQRVLVVGFGNSGGEIAVDLCEHGAQPSLAVRGPVNLIPRELFGIPILAIGIVQSKLPPGLADALNGPILRAAVGDLTRYGLRKLPRGPMSQIQRDGRIPLMTWARSSSSSAARSPFVQGSRDSRETG